MSGYVVAVLGACLILGFMIEMLRRRRLREKYAALWIVVSVLVMATVAFPGVLARVASALGVNLPVNLVFFGSIILLLAVAIQLSAEITSLERETQTLAEEMALLRYRLEVLERRADGTEVGTAQEPTKHVAGGGPAERPAS